MRSIPRNGRTMGLFVAAAVTGIGGASVQGGDRTAAHKIKSTTHQFTTRSIVVPESLAHFEIVAHDGPKITIVLTGLAKLVDTARLDVANGVLKIQDKSTQLDYTIVSDRQNIIVGSSNVIINNIGPSSNVPGKGQSFTEKEMKLLPLTYKISAPKRTAIRMERASGRITIDGLAGDHRIKMSGNGALTGARLAGQLSLEASENTTATISQATLERLSIAATNNTEVKFSGVAKQASVSAKGNADIEYSGTTAKADFAASGNGTIAASGDLKSVTRNTSGNADIEIR